MTAAFREDASCAKSFWRASPFWHSPPRRSPFTARPTAKIDAALKTASLSDSDNAKVMELRAKGEKEHKAGDHAASVAMLGEALKLLGM